MQLFKNLQDEPNMDITKHPTYTKLSNEDQKKVSETYQNVYINNQRLGVKIAQGIAFSTAAKQMCESVLEESALRRTKYCTGQGPLRNSHEYKNGKCIHCSQVEKPVKTTDRGWGRTALWGSKPEDKLPKLEPTLDELEEWRATPYERGVEDRSNPLLNVRNAARELGRQHATAGTRLSASHIMGTACELGKKHGVGRLADAHREFQLGYDEGHRGEYKGFDKGAGAGGVKECELKVKKSAKKVKEDGGFQATRDPSPGIVADEELPDEKDGIVDTKISKPGPTYEGKLPIYHVIDSARGGKKMSKHDSRQEAMTAAEKRNNPADPNRYRVFTEEDSLNEDTSTGHEGKGHPEVLKHGYKKDNDFGNDAIGMTIYNHPKGGNIMVGPGTASTQRWSHEGPGGYRESFKAGTGMKGLIKHLGKFHGVKENEWKGATDEYEPGVTYENEVQEGEAEEFQNANDNLVGMTEREYPPRESCGSCGADIGRSSSYPWHHEHEDCRAVKDPIIKKFKKLKEDEIDESVFPVTTSKRFVTKDSKKYRVIGTRDGKPVLQPCNVSKKSADNTWGRPASELMKSMSVGEAENPMGPRIRGINVTSQPNYTKRFGGNITKRAVIRDPSEPAGKAAKCHVNCGCGTKVPVYDPNKELTDRTCPKCKTTYDERGYIKGGANKGASLHNFGKLFKESEIIRILAIENEWKGATDEYEPGVTYEDESKDIQKKNLEEKCPKCGSSEHGGWLPPDFESVHCSDCGKTYEPGNGPTPTDDSAELQKKNRKEKDVKEEELTEEKCPASLYNRSHNFAKRKDKSGKIVGKCIYCGKNYNQRKAMTDYMDQTGKNYLDIKGRKKFNREEVEVDSLINATAQYLTYRAKCAGLGQVIQESVANANPQDETGGAAIQQQNKEEKFCTSCETIHPLTDPCPNGDLHSEVQSGAAEIFKKNRLGKGMNEDEIPTYMLGSRHEYKQGDKVLHANRVHQYVRPVGNSRHLIKTSDGYVVNAHSKDISPYNEVKEESTKCPKCGKPKSTNKIICRWCLAKYKGVKEDEIPEGYEGFEKLKGKFSHQKGIYSPGGLAASIGRKKYGAGRFNKAAHAGEKLGEDEIGKIKNIRQIMDDTENAIADAQRSGRNTTILRANLSDLQKGLQRLQLKKKVVGEDEIWEDKKYPTHAQHSQAVKPSTPCTASHITFGGKCLNCGWKPEDKCEKPVREATFRQAKRELGVPEKHQLAIARKTLQMSDMGAHIMGGPSKEEARRIIARLTGKPANESEWKGATDEYEPGNYAAEGELPKETIGQRLDRMMPAKCLACKTPYKRTDAKWDKGASRDICSKCGLDQDSAEAGAIAMARKKKSS